MADLFYSPRLTLVRAQDHIRNFNMLVSELAKGKPYTHFTEQDPDTGEHIHKIKFTRLLPDMLPCVLFDIAIIRVRHLTKPVMPLLSPAGA